MSKPYYRRVVINIISLITVFLMMAAAAIVRDGHIAGHSIKPTENETVKAETITSDGTVTINTTELAKDVTGYSGPVPVEIIIRNNVVDSIKTLENTETPGFFKRVLTSGILNNWTGKSPQEAMDTPVDAITGATYSSSALTANVRTGLQYYISNDITSQILPAPAKGAVFYCSLIVAVMAAILPLFIKNKKYRIIQQILNAGVLGFWSGTFVDYTMMLGYMSWGMTTTAAIVPAIMLITAFIYPLFGKNGYYCAWVCPLGSLQELASRCNTKHRVHLSAQTVSWLSKTRIALWSVLMLCLWCGMWASWIDYELFTAFMVKEAAAGIIAAGALFILLSVFIPRPYCRFVCPTGTLLKLSQDTNSK